MQRLPQSIENAIHTWLSDTLTGVTVIWANEDNPRPPLPFAALNVISGPRPVGPAAQQYKALNTYAYTFRKACVLSVQVYGNSALPRVNGIINALELPTKQEILRNAGIAVWEVSAPSDITALMDTFHEPRAMVDLTLAWAEAMDDAPGEIQSVNVTGTAGGHITDNLIGV